MISEEEPLKVYFCFTQPQLRETESWPGAGLQGHPKTLLGLHGLRVHGKGTQPHVLRGARALALWQRPCRGDVWALRGLAEGRQTTPTPGPRAVSESQGPCIVTRSLEVPTQPEAGPGHPRPLRLDEPGRLRGSCLEGLAQQPGALSHSGGQASPSHLGPAGWRVAGHSWLTGHSSHASLLSRPKGPRCF